MRASSDSRGNSRDSWVRCPSSGEGVCWEGRKRSWSYRAEERLAERLLQADAKDAATREQEQRW